MLPNSERNRLPGISQNASITTLSTVNATREETPRTRAASARPRMSSDAPSVNRNTLLEPWLPKIASTPKSRQQPLQMLDQLQPIARPAPRTAQIGPATKLAATRQVMLHGLRVKGRQAAISSARPTRKTGTAIKPSDPAAASAVTAVIL